MFFSLERFLESGALGNLEIGIAQEAIVAGLGSPAQTGLLEAGEIWKYGSLELHFDEENRLALIFIEDSDEGTSVRKSAAVAFRFSDGLRFRDDYLFSHREVTDCENYLNRLGLSFRRVWAEPLVLQLGSRVRLTFNEKLMLHSLAR